MKQEETEKNFSLWKFLQQINFDMIIILVLCRILTMSSSLIEFIDEKGEYSLAFFGAGGAFFIIWIRLKREFSEEDYKKIRWHLSLPFFTAIYFWVKAIAKIFELF